MFILLEANQAQPVKKHTDFLVTYSSPFFTQKKKGLSTPIWSEVMMCSFFVLLLVRFCLKEAWKAASSGLL